MDINPLKAERLKRNLTQAQLANLSGISQNAIVKSEQGLYKHPSDNVISAFFNYDLRHNHGCNYSQFKEKLSVAYQIWRVQKLITARPHLASGRYYGSLVRPVGLHPMADWRINYLGLTSQMQLCKLLVIHPSILSQYESGRTRTMPADIKFALNACELPETTVEALDIEGALYFDSLGAFSNV